MCGLRMQAQQKWAIVVLFVLSGAIILSISQYSIAMEIEQVRENGEKYELYAPSYGANLTRYFNTGEKIGVKLTAVARSSVVSDLLPLNFTIITPGQSETVFVYWLEPYSNPLVPPPLFPRLMVTELEILKVQNIILDDSSKLRFAGEVTEDGNYTLLFTSNYNEANSPLSYLALTKITFEKVYPYTFMVPLGIGIVAVGIILTFWTIRSSKKKHLRSITRKKQIQAKK